MGELEKYGLLSLASVAALFLVLTFVQRDFTEGSEALRVPDDESAYLVVGEAEAADSPRQAPRPVPPPAKKPGAVKSAPQQSVSSLPETAQFHVVKKGDTLSAIARRHLGAARRWPELVAMNGHLDPKRLQIGQKIRIAPAREDEAIPGAASGAPAADRADSRKKAAARKRTPPRPSANQHKVVSGDTLSRIAYRYYGDAMQWKRIYRANSDRIADARKLEPGTVLKLP